jgi:homoserine O-acetyltransferase
VTLSDSIDRHAVDLTKITARTLFVAAQGDQISPPADLRRCAAATARARYVEIVSQYGHDAFLKEAPAIGPFIKNFLKESGK